MEHDSASNDGMIILACPPLAALAEVKQTPEEEAYKKALRELWFQDLCNYVHRHTITLGLYRQGKSIYAERVVNGQKTHSLERVMSLDDHIYKITDFDYNRIQWRNRTMTPRTMKRLLKKILKDYPDTVRTNRGVFSCQDGVWNSNRLMWIPFVPTKEEVVDHRHIGDASDLPREFACNYLDCPMKYRGRAPSMDSLSNNNKEESVVDWASRTWMSTLLSPKLDRMLLETHYNRHIKMLFYVFVGRLVFESGDLDDWKILFAVDHDNTGITSSHKNQLIDSILSMYPRECIYEDDYMFSVDANHAREIMWVPPNKSSLVWRRPIYHDTQVDHASLYRRTQGEEHYVVANNGSTKSVPWKLSNVFETNNLKVLQSHVFEYPNALVWQFPKIPKNMDKSVSDMRPELPDLIRKCTTAFVFLKQWLKEHDKTIHDVIPNIFKRSYKRPPLMDITELSRAAINTVVESLRQIVEESADGVVQVPWSEFLFALGCHEGPAWVSSYFTEVQWLAMTAQHKLVQIVDLGTMDQIMPDAMVVDMPERYTVLYKGVRYNTGKLVCIKTKEEE